ncbi:MAG: DUF3795 domain-containing protein [Actinomycetota bacterium]
MYEMISFCGLDCSECPAYRATQAGDMEELARVAKEWSEQFKMEIPPESILCDSCKSGEGARRSGYCDTCQVRICALEGGVVTCAHCDEYGCETLRACPAYSAEGKDRLDEIRDKLG